MFIFLATRTWQSAIESLPNRNAPIFRRRWNHLISTIAIYLIEYVWYVTSILYSFHNSIFGLCAYVNMGIFTCLSIYMVEDLLWVYRWMCSLKIFVRLHVHRMLAWFLTCLLMRFTFELILKTKRKPTKKLIYVINYGKTQEWKHMHTHKNNN